MRVHRLIQSRFAGTALTGHGARLYGGRWNSPGTAVIYAADSIALAALELLVHLHRPCVLGGYRLFTLTLPEAACLPLDPAALPPDWRAEPPAPATARLGDAWVASRASLALTVPSRVVPRERNLLINPAHPAFPALLVTATDEPFAYDPRLAAD